MYELILTMNRTPHGMCIRGPDPDRVIYLPVLNNQTRAHTPSFGGENVWHSPALDIFVFPAADGVDLKLRIHSAKPQPASAAKAA